ncbi:hypothetical protein [Aquabacterium soli]|jgi:hypothetical protein|uniref:hypothetical protein n=1 Tax=Aquabacterium soli TaxID=2493092 RepID=UPI0013159332|nr:hypothetical protein [Aquabacterium soli]
MVTKPPTAHTRRAFRWRLLVAVLGLIVLDHFLAPAHAARQPAQTGLMAAASVTGLLR